jgi:hypothetical protein
MLEALLDSLGSPRLKPGANEKKPPFGGWWAWNDDGDQARSPCTSGLGNVEASAKADSGDRSGDLPAVESYVATRSVTTNSKPSKNQDWN